MPIWTRLPITTRLVSKIVRLGPSNQHVAIIHESAGYVGEVADLLPVDKAVAANDDIAAVIRHKRRLHECAFAHLSTQLAEQFESLLKDLIVGNGLGVQVVVVAGQAAALVPSREQLGRVGVIPNPTPLPSATIVPIFMA